MQMTLEFDDIPERGNGNALTSAAAFPTAQPRPPHVCNSGMSMTWQEELAKPVPNYSLIHGLRLMARR